MISSQGLQSSITNVNVFRGVELIYSGSVVDLLIGDICFIYGTNLDFYNISINWLNGDMNLRECIVTGKH